VFYRPPGFLSLSSGTFASDLDLLALELKLAGLTVSPSPSDPGAAVLAAPRPSTRTTHSRGSAGRSWGGSWLQGAVSERKTARTGDVAAPRVAPAHEPPRTVMSFDIDGSLPPSSPRRGGSVEERSVLCQAAPAEQSWRRGIVGLLGVRKQSLGPEGWPVASCPGDTPRACRGEAGCFATPKPGSSLSVTRRANPNDQCAGWHQTVDRAAEALTGPCLAISGHTVAPTPQGGEGGRRRPRLVSCPVHSLFQDLASHTVVSSTLSAASPQPLRPGLCLGSAGGQPNPKPITPYWKRGGGAPKRSIRPRHRAFLSGPASDPPERPTRRVCIVGAAEL